MQEGVRWEGGRERGKETEKKKSHFKTAREREREEGD